MKTAEERARMHLSPKYWRRSNVDWVNGALEKALYNCEEGSYVWALAAETVHLRAEVDALQKKAAPVSLSVEEKQAMSSKCSCAMCPMRCEHNDDSAPVLRKLIRRMMRQS